MLMHERRRLEQVLHKLLRREGGTNAAIDESATEIEQILLMSGKPPELDPRYSNRRRDGSDNDAMVLKDVEIPPSPLTAGTTMHPTSHFRRGGDSRQAAGPFSSDPEDYGIDIRRMDVHLGDICEEDKVVMRGKSGTTMHPTPQFARSDDPGDIEVVE